MSDFIREVDEDYRRDRAVAFLKRFQIPLVAAIVLVIVGAGVWRWWTDSKVTAAQQENTRFAAAQTLAKSGKSADAVAAFDAIAKDGPAGYAMLARMRAAEAMAAQDPEAAAKAFDAIADDNTLPASMGNTARFRGALLRVDRLDPKAFEQRYAGYAEPGFAYHSSMRELLALEALKRGDGAAAGRYLDDIIVDPGAPTALRNRAEAFRALVSAGAAGTMSTQPPPARVSAMAPTAPAAGASSPTSPVPTPPSAEAPSVRAPSAAAPSPATAAPPPAATKPPPVVVSPTSPTPGSPKSSGAGAPD